MPKASSKLRAKLLYLAELKNQTSLAECVQHIADKMWKGQGWQRGTERLNAPQRYWHAGLSRDRKTQRNRSVA